MATAELTEERQFELRHPQRMVLYDILWDTYQTISTALADRHLRFAYEGGTLDFMTISSTHGRLSRLLGRLIVVLAEEFDQPLASFGDMTCDREDLDRGIEADETYYLINEAKVRHKEQIDLQVDPPPDLGVEIDIASSSQRRMRIYAAIGVPEVWRYDQRTLTIHRLVERDRYTVAEQSQYFPHVSATQIAEFLNRWNLTDENSLVREFRQCVRYIRAGSAGTADD